MLGKKTVVENLPEPLAAAAGKVGAALVLVLDAEDLF